MNNKTVTYAENGKIAYFNGIRFTRDEKTGYYLAAREIDGKRPRLHKYVWEYFNGKVPKGCHVHHIDHDKSNNTIENLTCMTAGEHSSHHGKDREFTEAMAKHLEEIRELTKEWHASEEGHEWHVKHGKEVAEKIPMTKFVCDNCGKEFEVKVWYRGGNHFCCNNCKSAYRRKMGYDNVEKVCAECGKTYIANKYQKTKYCSDCKGAGSRNRWKRERLQLGSADIPQVCS